MILLVEGLALSFFVLMVCVVGIANGPVGSVYFYEKDVQDRVVELGLTTREEISRRKRIAAIFLFVPLLVLVPMMAYSINGARGFRELFLEMLAIMMIEGLFDRIFIDFYWVGKTKAWIIPGTEDLMPYVPRRTMLGKWIATLIGYPLLSAILALIVSRL